MIVGITGKRLSGKDTAGKYLVEKYGFTRIGNADKMKDGVAALWGITREEVDEFKDNRGGSLDRVEVHLDVGGTIRYTYGWVEFLQRFGTEMGRDTWGKDTWVNMAFPLPSLMDELEIAIHGIENIVVTDLRFENEAQRILDLGGTIIQLLRPSVIDSENDSHESEAGLPPDLIEYVIENTSTLDDLYKDLDAILEHIHANS